MRPKRKSKKTDPCTNPYTNPPRSMRRLSPRRCLSKNAESAVSENGNAFGSSIKSAVASIFTFSLSLSSSVMTFAYVSIEMSPRSRASLISDLSMLSEFPVSNFLLSSKTSSFFRDLIRSFVFSKFSFFSSIIIFSRSLFSLMRFRASL